MIFHAPDAQWWVCVCVCVRLNLCVPGTASFTWHDERLKPR
jgi:hypothetical protein